MFKSVGNCSDRKTKVERGLSAMKRLDEAELLDMVDQNNVILSCKRITESICVDGLEVRTHVH
jgi:hypothetical protein